MKNYCGGHLPRCAVLGILMYYMYIPVPVLRAPCIHPPSRILKMKRAKKLPNPAPRNPLVAEALFRKAGAHGKSRKALRRGEKMELQKLAEDK